MNLKQSLEKHDFHGVWMRLLALAMILIVAVSALIASPVSANAAEVGDPSAVKGKTYAVGTDTTFAPFEYRENGKMTGIDMELIRAIAQEEGFEVTIQSLGFNAALQALSSNQVDVVIAGMSIMLTQVRLPCAQTRQLLSHNLSHEAQDLYPLPDRNILSLSSVLSPPHLNQAR